MFNPNNDPLAAFRDRRHHQRRMKQSGRHSHQRSQLPRQFNNFDPEEIWAESETERDAEASRLFDENPELDRIIIPYSGGIDIYDRLPPDRFDQIDPDWDREVA